MVTNFSGIAYNPSIVRQVKAAEETSHRPYHQVQKASDLALELCPHSRALYQQPVNIDSNNTD